MTYNILYNFEIFIGINVTQWRLLLNLNPQALEGISPNTIKCLDEQKVKVSITSSCYHELK